MTITSTLNARIVEGLYAEALVLSDEVRSVFDLSGRIEATGSNEDALRIALSCEALRTTTRMMHAMAWLLNHRAFFMGELSAFQLRRYGRLAPDFPTSDPMRMTMLNEAVRALILATEHFYARLLRIDQQWREEYRGTGPSGLERLRARLDSLTQTAAGAA
jgi:regulator of CtrA degradation